MNCNPIVQFLWIGKEISRMEKLSMKSFLKNSFQVHLYTYDFINDLPRGVILMDANMIIPADKIFKYKDYDSYSGFSNLFRYKLLMEKGGFWSDLDIIYLKPITENEQFVFASERLPNKAVRVCSCFIGAPKNSKIMEYCYLFAKEKNPESLHWGQTGPELLTDAVIKFELEEYVVDPVVICPVNYWNCQYFIYRSINENITKDTYAIHLWNEMWRRNKMDKSIIYSKNCIYEELQEKYM